MENIVNSNEPPVKTAPKRKKTVKQTDNDDILDKINKMNDYNIYSFFGSPNKVDKPSYIKASNIFNVKDKTIKTDLKKTDKETKHKVAQNNYKTNNEVVETKKTKKDNDENTLSRHLKILKKNKDSFD